MLSSERISSATPGVRLHTTNALFWPQQIQIIANNTSASEACSCTYALHWKHQLSRCHIVLTLSLPSFASIQLKSYGKRFCVDSKSDRKGALSHLRVLDLSRVLAGSSCSLIPLPLPLVLHPLTSNADFPVLLIVLYLFLPSYIRKVLGQHSIWQISGRT